MYKLNLDLQDFMANYWQRKPLLIRGGFKDFEDPISPEEMAGLAMEEDVQSRLVHKDSGGHWQAECGPFQSFERLDHNGATLLNQAVNHWHGPSAELANAFQFIPSWRFDDLMISYSTPEGGVGPHIDNYCVFIIQGQGKRHWRVGEKQPLKEFAAHGVLKHCEAFDASIDAILEPGDVLYIPPGCPHEGYAVETAINYSVGFRAQDQKELLNDFSDYLLQQDRPFSRYSDPDLQPRSQYGAIGINEVAQLQQLMTDIITDKSVLFDFLGQNLSASSHELDLAPLSKEEQVSLDILKGETEIGSYLVRISGLKCLYFAELDNAVFINGERYNVDPSIADGIRLLCNQLEITADELTPWLEKPAFSQCLITWIDAGLFYFE